MLLTSTSDIIRIVTSAAVDVDIQAGWADQTTTAFTPGRTNTKVTTATTTTIVSAPGASTQRQVKTIVIRNIHATDPNTVTVQHYDGTTSDTVFKRTLAASESIAYDGTKWLTYNSTGNQTITTSAGDALTTNPLSQFAATTSAQLAGVISDETGTDKVVFNTSPTLVTPVLGVATATTVNKVTLTAPASGSTLTIADGATLTVSASATISNGTHSGTNTGDQTDISGNAATVTIADAGGDTTTFPLLGTSATGNLVPATDAGLTYNATTNALTATTFIGALTGAASGNLTSANIVATITNGVTTNAPSEDAVFDALALKAPLASPTFTGTVTLPVGLTGVIRTDTGVVSVDADVTDIVAAASATAQGKVELATDAETVTGTDTARATTPANITAKMAAPGAIGGTTAANITGLVIQANTGIIPDANDGAYLGTTAAQFSDLFLAEGGVINWDNGDATLTQVGNVVTLAGADLVVDNLTLNTALLPDANDGAALGSTTLQFSDLFLAEGGVINFDNGDATLTQVGDVVTLAGADLKITTPGTASTSVATIDGTQTLTNKTYDLGENLPIILDAALSADGKYSGITEAGTAGATLAFGNLCYLAAADSRWELTDADADATAGPVKLGICILAAAADGSATTMLLIGKIRADAAFPAMTISAPVYVSTTAGAIQVAAPSGAADIIRVVGWANTADELYFNPAGNWFEHV